MKIEHIAAESVTDTRGKPTVQVTLVTEGLSASASVPSGKSVGSHEAKELRDKDGSVKGAIHTIENEIAQALSAHDFDSPDTLDAFLITLDGTSDKSRLGANAILAVSIAATRLFALGNRAPLWRAIAERAGTTPSAPRLYVNVMNGGMHADFRLPFQEYMLVVEGEPSAAYATAQRAFSKLGARLGNVPMGDEGGYSPAFPTLDEPFEILSELVLEHPDTSIAIDAAANELQSGDGYKLLGNAYTPDELLMLYEKLVRNFPFHSIEDPFVEDDGEHFASLTAALGEKILIVGDDLTATNPSLIKDAAARKEANAVIVKPNQIGTVREALEAVKVARDSGWSVICSHRSGETGDTFIADFAYGIGAEGIKAGAFGQRERRAKYERLVAIESEAKLHSL